MKNNTYMCPTCECNSFFDAGHGMYICSHCDEDFKLEKLIPVAMTMPTHIRTIATLILFEMYREEGRNQDTIMSIKTLTHQLPMVYHGHLLGALYYLVEANYIDATPVVGEYFLTEEGRAYFEGEVF